MKIDSSFIGMESARRYSSVDAGAVSYHKEGSIPVSSMDGTKSFSDFLSISNFSEFLIQPERNFTHSSIICRTPKTFGTLSIRRLKLQAKLSSKGVSLNSFSISASGSSACNT